MKVIGGCTVHHADCIDVMRGMNRDSIDAVVTDPPYLLEFMGKEFDKQHHAHDGENIGQKMQSWYGTWARELYKVMKPGAHAAIFGGTRTWHRLACAVEDAGFELRDTLMWVYGTGFPKSHSIEKAIDRTRDDKPDILHVTAFVRVARDAAGLTNAQVDTAVSAPGMSDHWTRRSPLQAAIPTWSQWLALKALLGFGDEMDVEVWRLNGRKGQPGDAWHEREVIGERTTGLGTGRGAVAYIGDSDNRDITAPATDAAKRWAGWGSALKPAWEPILICRRPLSEPTLAANVLKHGTGAIHVDACRVEADWANDPSKRGFGHGYNREGYEVERDVPVSANVRTGWQPTQGRWPANLCHDSSPEVFEAFATFAGGRREGWYSGEVKRGIGYGSGVTSDADGSKKAKGTGDTGTASRYFPALGLGEDELRFMYTSKANKSDRAGSKNPCVKPQSLLKWLARLITPPGGTILDPFAGSGSLGQAAIAEGFKAILIERELEYYNGCIRRMEAARPPADLFSEPAA